MRGDAIETKEVRGAYLEMERFYPQKTTGFQGAFVAFHKSSATTLSGDYVHFDELVDGSLFICVLDAEGHGLRPAMQVRLLMDTIQDPEWQELPPGQAMSAIEQKVRWSRVLQAENAAFPMSILRISPRRDSVTYANAGMPFPMVSRKGCLVRVPQAWGWEVGRGYSERSSGDVTFPLEDKDLLIVASDGVLEGVTQGGAQLRSELPDMISGVMSPEDLVQRVVGRLEAVDDEGARNRRYDRALLVVECKPIEEVAVWRQTVVRNDGVYGRLHGQTRPGVMSWLGSLGVEKSVANRIWLASWEAILNGLKHGTYPEQTLAFAFRYSGGFIELWVTQKVVWVDWEQDLMAAAQAGVRGGVLRPIVCGTRIMANLADQIAVDAFGGRTRLTFNI